MSMGFVGLPYVKTAKAVAVADDDESQPFLPTMLTVKKEDYLLSRRLYFYITDKSSNPNVADFIKFAESDAGQNAVTSVGFINFSILDKEITNANIPCELSPKWTLSNHDAYCKLHDTAIDSGIEFHFKEGTSEIDNRGFQDTQRLMTALGNHKIKSNHITLVGFADSTGDYAANIALAKQRAESVSTALKMLGFESNTVSFGAELPVRSNHNAAGREANRRVEVWLPK